MMPHSVRFRSCGSWLRGFKCLRVTFSPKERGIKPPQDKKCVNGTGAIIAVLIQGQPLTPFA
jgi:hypothetical protein